MDLEACLDDIVLDLDPDVKQYILSVLKENSAELNSIEDVEDAIGPILESYSSNNFSIRELCSRFAVVLKQHNACVAQAGIQLLHEPVRLSVFDSKQPTGPSLIALSQQTAPTRSFADLKKLEKAEKKLMMKQEKRVEKSMMRPIYFGELTATVSHRTSRREEQNDARGQGVPGDLHVDSLDISYGSKKLLTNADLRLARGRRYGLVGRNGVGKTTLLKMISSGNVHISSNIRVLHVEQEVEGNDTPVIDCVLRADDRRQRLIDEEEKIKTLMVENGCEKYGNRMNEIYEELQLMESDKAPARAAAILFGLGFDENDQKRPTKEYSGGWRMRVALAQALFVRPDLLLLDEPTNMLDMKTVLWLENYLLTWPSILCVVSHDRTFLNAVVTDIVYMHNQVLDYYTGNYDQFEKTRNEALLNQQREYEAQKQFRAHVQEFIDRFRYNAKRASLVQSKIKMLEKLPELVPVETEPPVVLRFLPCEPLNPPILQLEDVTFYYNAKKPLLKNVNFIANMESRICMVGDNGAGKTTVLKLLCGILEPVKGERLAHRLLKVAYFTQHHVDQLVMDVSPVELIQKRFPGTKYEECRANLGRFGLTGDTPLQRISTLSGGQKSRLAFALISMMRPNFLILDEPTNHLDIETVDALGVALQEFQGGLIVVSHEERLIDMICKELVIVRDGTVSQLPGGLEEYKAAIEKDIVKLS